MNVAINKRMKILKQENIALSNYLKKIKKEIQETNIDNERLATLIIEVEDLRSQFIKAIKDLNTAKNRYNALNKELMEVKQSLQVIRVPLCRKLLMKIKMK